MFFMQKSHNSNNQHIAIVDSGVGAIAIYDALLKHNFNCSYAVIADNEGFPYGAFTKAQLTVHLDKLVASVAKLIEPDLLIVACNTASTHILATLRQKYNFDIIGVVPALKPANTMTVTKNIALLCTQLTANSNYIQQLIAEHNPDSRVHIKPCDNLALCAENYLVNSEQMPKAEIDYLTEFFSTDANNCDVCVLGCTHYSLLLPILKDLAPNIKHWLDTREAIATRLKTLLNLTSNSITGDYKNSFYCTKPGYDSAIFAKYLQQKQLQLKPDLTHSETC